MSRGPLEGLVVVELAGGVAGPYAGRLLAMLGATVLKVPPPGGDPARWMPIDDEATADPGPLYVHLNAGKQLVSAPADEVVNAADVVLDDRVRAQRQGTSLDPARLVEHGAVVVSMTAWGYEAADAGQTQDELFVQAASGIMSALTEDGHDPTRLPGWQSQYLAGGYGAAGALAALAQLGGHHVDVSWAGSVVTGVEAGLCSFLDAVEQPPRAEAAGDRPGGLQVGTFPAGVFACADGAVIPGTVRPFDWDLQCGVYGRPDLLADERFDARHRFANRDVLRQELQPWYEARTKREIFEAALDAGWAAAMVITAGDALGDPHLAERRFLTGVDTGRGRALIPARPWRAHDTPEGVDTAVALVPEPVAEWRAPVRRNGRVAPPALDGVKVLELTWAWAGPFVGRFASAYGADVVRLETGRYPDGWRTRVRWRDTGVPIPDGEDPDAVTWDAGPPHNSVNRGKRSLSLDLTQAEGRSVFLELLARADALVLNMSYKVLADRGVEDDVRAAVDRGLVVVNMPALGATGPYRDMPGYGILMEGMGGLAARYGDRSEPARATTTYYPDLVAGLHGAVALLSGLAGKRSTGRGRFVDLSQQEATWMLLAEGLVARSLDGREPARMGNAEPHVAPSGLYPAADHRWVALAVGNDGEWAALVQLVGAALERWAAAPLAVRMAARDEIDAAIVTWTRTLGSEELSEALTGAGIRAMPARSQRRAYHSGFLDELGLIEWLDHPVTGKRPYLALPVRIDGQPWRSRRPAPRFAEHTDEVLDEWLGMDARERDRLRAAAVIGTTPRQPTRR